VPVVVELFSSEGCSSCPPADTTLADLDRLQPVSGAQILALELHVDYWNDLGWSDPYSSAAISHRQRQYAAVMGARSVYTPQAIVDGTHQVVGSNRDGLVQAIAAASAASKTPLIVERRADQVSITVGALPHPGVLWLAVTQSGLSTAVPRGENAGQTLHHGPVVRSLIRVGTVSAGGGVITAPLGLSPEWDLPSLTLVAIVADDPVGAVLAAGSLPLAR
jgi:hypothetical protein